MPRSPRPGVSGRQYADTFSCVRLKAASRPWLDPSTFNVWLYVLKYNQPNVEACEPAGLPKRPENRPETTPRLGRGYGNNLLVFKARKGTGNIVMTIQRGVILGGAFMGLAAVLAGTFGAHVLKDQLSPEYLQVFETGVRYQMYHALGALLAGLLAGASGASGVSGVSGGGVVHARWACWGGAFFLAGVVFFSGSLYTLTLTGVRWLGAITPVGGLCFVIGWSLLIASVVAPGSAHGRAPEGSTRDKSHRS